MTKKRFIVSMGALMLLFAFAFPLIHAAMAKPAVPPSNHPNMDAALHSLQEARKHLEQAEPKFAGHRDAAIKHVDAAIEEVHAAFRDNP